MTETLGARIKRLRKERGLGLRETAAKVGISATFLSRVETNAEKAVPREEVIKKLADLLGDDVDTLMQLAGRVAQDVAAVIKSEPGMPAVLRRARDLNLSADDLMKLIDKSKKGKR